MIISNSLYVVAKLKRNTRIWYSKTFEASGDSRAQGCNCKPDWLWF